MGSFALYSNKDLPPLSIDAHFNLWNQCGWDNDETFLDVGIMISNLNDGHQLCIRFPFNFDSSNMVSLSDALLDVETLNAIFNESYSLNTDNSKWVRVLNGKKEVFSIYLIELKNTKHCSIDTHNDDTLVTLNIPVASEKIPSGKVYIRFRIKLYQDRSIIRSYDRPYKWIRGAFQQSYVIDFRYNDKRSLSKDILEEIESNHQWVRTAKVHFLLISKASVNVECGGTVKKRMLEGNVWAKYLDGEGDKHRPRNMDNLVAYHATSKVTAVSRTPNSQDNGGDIVSWEFFAKQEVDAIDSVSFLYFMVVTIVLGTMYGVFGNWFYNFLCRIFATNT